jgi:hypothetical protein
MKRQGTLGEHWKDFWVFVKDVGERPSAEYRLWRPDESVPYTLNNFEWVEKDNSFRGLDDKQTRAAYARRYRAENPDKLKNAHLKVTYGITLAYYNSMKEAQNSVCSICGLPETTKIHGQVIDLAVDHDHATGKVRALLCHHCNKALGGFKDSPALLNKAIEYLNKHSEVSS